MTLYQVTVFCEQSLWYPQDTQCDIFSLMAIVPQETFSLKLTVLFSICLASVGSATQLRRVDM